jgi:hypothetical protein
LSQDHSPGEEFHFPENSVARLAIWPQVTKKEGQTESLESMGLLRHPGKGHRTLSVEEAGRRGLRPQGGPSFTMAGNLRGAPIGSPRLKE